MKLSRLAFQLASFCIAASYNPVVAADVLKTRVESDASHSVLARLLSSFDIHAVAARRWYAQATHGRHVDEAEFERFSRPLLTNRMVSFTYDYVRNGKPRVRVYQARSGRNDPWYFVKTAHGTGSYASYFARHSTDVVAWDRKELPGGDVAERKVAQQIERDIRNGAVEAGGTLHGYASSDMCDICEASLKALSDKRGIQVHVAYFEHGGVLWRRLDNLRRQYIASIYTATNGTALNRPTGRENAPAPIFGCLDYSDEVYE